MNRIWQDEWSLAAHGHAEHRLFIEPGPHSGWMAGIEARSINGTGYALLRQRAISEEMKDRILSLFGEGVGNA